MNSGSQPLVSVIIPTYNRFELLKEAVESCLCQIYPNIEVIVVDDGSADGTAAFVENRIKGEWAGRVRYYVQCNAGASAARNRGLELARGKYVQFLDSDDIILPYKIEHQLRQLVCEPIASGCSCYGRGGDREQTRLCLTNRIGIKCATPIEYIQRMCGGATHVMQTAAPIWRRAFLEESSTWCTELGFGDDWEYYIRLLARASAISFVEEELFLVLGHSGPRLGWANRSREQTLSALRAQERVLETVSRSGILDKGIQNGLLRKARGTYANLLDLGTDSDIAGFERWFLGLSQKPKYRLLPHMLVAFRRVFGRKFTFILYQTVLKAKQRVHD